MLRTLIATSLFVLCAATARAETHALIMTISAYEGGVPPLAGVQHDGDNARAMARKLGVPDANIRQLRDKELTLAGMRRALEELAQRIAPNDQVFIYYSGHGGRTLVRESEPRCAESLVSVDAKFLPDAELEAKLKALAQKAEKVIVFLDACHSGGVTTRSLGRQAQYTPKFWAGKGGAACEKPVNVLTRNLGVAAKSAGSGAQNFVVVASARADEISLDQPGRGGVATQAWLACMSGAAQDADRSGSLTAEEIRRCAQQRIDDALKNADGYLPHHIAITGNPNAVLALNANNGASSAASSAVSPVNTLLDIYNRRDDRRLVTLTPAKSALTIGRDKFEVSLTSREAGYVYLLMVGSDGKTFDMLFPNALDKNNVIAAGETLRLPRADWEVTAHGPAGKNFLLAIVSDAPRDFARLGMQPAGPFSVVDATPLAAKDIVLVSGSSANASTHECAEAPLKRSLAVQKKCSNAYGAALVTVEEVQ
jgi:hypothetical protein